LVSIYKIRNKIDRDVPQAFPVSLNGSNWKSGILRRSLGISGLAVVSITTLLIWVTVFSYFFGYQVIDARGVSMEPSLKDGDALWAKQSALSEVKTGDIVTLGFGEESITHRVVEIEPVSDRNYHIVTQGDANTFTEGWNISRDRIVPVVVGRIPFGGYVLDFIAGFTGKVLLISLVAILISYVLFHKRSYGTIH
jgi:signal peptidase I